jgi:putative transcription factor
VFRMRQNDIVYCEIFGRPVRRRDARIVYIEGAKLILCPECYRKVVKRGVSSEMASLKPEKKVPATTRVRPKPTVPSKPRRKYIENVEVVPDYAERVRKARERLGWSQRVLAEAIGEGENVIKRIEAGRLTPSVDQAKKLERVLNIKLLEPIVENNSLPQGFSGKFPTELTLGDIAALRKKKGS